MYSDQITISIKETLENQKEREKENNQEQIFQELKEDQLQLNQQMLTIKISDDYYMIVEKSKLNEVYKSDQQWQQFLLQIYPHYPFNLKQLNSIISIRKQQKIIRQKYWQLITQKCKNRQNILLNNISNDYCEDERQLQKNICRMYQKFNQGIPIQQHKMIKNILLRYANAQPQIGYTKGLQYLCYGIIKSHPSFQQQKIQRAFIYIMQEIRIKQLFYQGSPLFYQQLQGLEQQLKIQTPYLWQILLSNEADNSKIFIRYYKTILLSSVYDGEIARKIFQLLVVYGIKIVRLLLVKILAKNEKLIIEKLQNPDLLFQYIANYTVVDFFCNNQLLLKLKMMNEKENKVKNKNQIQNEVNVDEQKKYKINGIEQNSNQDNEYIDEEITKREKENKNTFCQKKDSFIPKFNINNNIQGQYSKLIQFKIDKQKQITLWLKQLLFSQ